AAKGMTIKRRSDRHMRTSPSVGLECRTGGFPALHRKLYTPHMRQSCKGDFARCIKPTAGTKVRFTYRQGRAPVPFMLENSRTRFSHDALAASHKTSNVIFEP